MAEPVFSEVVAARTQSYHEVVDSKINGGPAPSVGAGDGGMLVLKDTGMGEMDTDAMGMDMDADPMMHMGFDPMDAARTFEARQTKRSSVGMATAFGGSSKSRVGVSLQFDNVSLEVTNEKNKETVHVLSDISGCAPSGEVLAIMGSSGAGKTTLLNLLGASLIDTGNVKFGGEILVNGSPRNFKQYSSYTAIVLQDDLFFPELTVRETIAFSATLRLPRSMSQQQKDERVTSIISELGLRDVQHTNVGNDLVRGVSGGERKRVNIGTELVSDPSLIFLDEPTSGLDSFQAQNVMVALKVLAKHGRTVVSTIHQPRSDIYLMFDKLLILSKGKEMYFGNAGETAIDYFKRCGYACPPHYNPADYFIDLISFDGRSPDLEQRSLQRIAELEEALKAHFADTGTHRLPASELKRLSMAAEDGPIYQVSTWQQFKTLLPRSWNSVIREKAGNMQILIMQIIPALMLGLIWLNEGSDLFGGEKIQAIGGALFFSVIHNMFNPVFPIASTFPLERDVVIKERMSRTYTIGPYFITKAVTELPRAALVVMVFTVISYFMVDLRPGAHYFFVHYLFLLLICCAAEGIALMVSAAAKGPMEASAAVPGPLVISILFGGFFIPADQIPVFMSWLRYLALTKYGFEGVMQNQFNDRNLCDQPDNNCTCSSRSEFCPQTGEEVLQFYDLKDLTIVGNALALLAYGIITRILAYIILRRNVPKRVQI
mmetsp:Transcript_3106/g.7465  ORF Transcript_3106/g.7465 Transcript_3106/m.7465 type:complete len:715 (+) Transcript_3106:70-2214(+)